ncbi:hypothetical protein BaRGS_00026408 [Batillaria attramentaria]|uniref:Uncharacterized protein n=1 Tax=Batillaria attramentaria TaxID=370345 RepID=A0ABD0K585_9CAEN
MEKCKLALGEGRLLSDHRRFGKAMFRSLESARKKLWIDLPSSAQLFQRKPFGGVADLHRPRNVHLAGAYRGRFESSLYVLVCKMYLEVSVI